MTQGDCMRLLETGRIELLSKLFRSSILPVSKRHIKNPGTM
jgi:hypothetical protein